MDFKSLGPSGPYVFRVGSVSVTVPNLAGHGNSNVVLTPALDSIANYKAQCCVNDPLSTGLWASSHLISISLLVVSALRQTANANLSPTGITVAGTDLSDVSGMTTNPISETVTGPHGSSATIDHGHNNLAHPVTDPSHSHVISYGTAVTVNVDWMLIHI